MHLPRYFKEIIKIMPLAAIKIATAALLGGVSLLRFNKGGITLDDVLHMGPEYGVAAIVGLFFGWGLHHGIDDAFNHRPGGSGTVAILGIVSPLLALILSHQTRSFLNDGPITLAMAVGLVGTTLVLLLRRPDREPR